MEFIFLSGSILQYCQLNLENIEMSKSECREGLEK